MSTQDWVNIGSGDSLLPDGNMPLYESIYTYQQWASVART